MMSASETIADQISQQQDIQEQLLELAKRQATVLRRGDAEALDELNFIVSQQQLLILRLGHMNREWMEKLPALASSLGLTESVTLTDLIDALPSRGDREELRRKAEAMRDTINLVRDQNTRNMEVIAFEAKLDDHFMREIVLQPIIQPGSDMAHQPRLVDVEA